MKHLFLLFSFFAGHLLFAQDYLIKEHFDPNNFFTEDLSGNLINDSVKESKSCHRFRESWGLNTNLNEEDELISVWGSNLFSISYAYSKPLFKGFNWNFGIGYNWDNYRLKTRNDMMLHDSISHDKVKLRIQNASLKTGFRLQTSEKDSSSFYLEVLGYLNIKTFTKYNTWDKLGTMKLTSSTSRLGYVNPYHYGVEARIGYSLFSFYARYRLSNIFDLESGYRELPRLALGVTFQSANN